MHIPMHTKTRASILLVLTILPSFRIIADKITPNTGFRNPITATFEIGL